MENLFNIFCEAVVLQILLNLHSGSVPWPWEPLIFFLLSLDAIGGKWRNSMLVSALITGIAAVHYLYMRDAYAAMGDEGVTAFRYVD